MLLVILPIIIRIVRGPSSQNSQTAAIGADNLEVWLIRMCPIIEACGFACMSLARNTTEYYLSGALAAMGGIGPPTLQSALTKHVAPGQMGELLGALSILQSLSRVVSPLVLNSVYSLTVATCPQIVFYALAGAMLVAFILSWGVRAHGKISLDVLTISEGRWG